MFKLPFTQIKQTFSGEDTERADPVDEAHAVWDRLVRDFGNFRGMRISFPLMLGVGERINRNRLNRLEKRPVAATVRDLLAPLSLRQTEFLAHRAQRNLTMANDAMRLFLIVNVSMPIGLFVGVNQIAPGFVAVIAGAFNSIPGLVAGLLIVLFYAANAWYAYSGLHQARDLNHLLSFAVAEHRLRDKKSILNGNSADGEASDNFDTDDVPDLTSINS